MLASRKSVDLALLLVGVLLLSGALRCPAGTGTLVEGMRGELAALRLPLFAVVAVIPFVAGLVTGIAMGFVGASFPLIFALLGEEPSLAAAASTAVVMVRSGLNGEPSQVSSPWGAT